MIGVQGSDWDGLVVATEALAKNNSIKLYNIILAIMWVVVKMVEAYHSRLVWPEPWASSLALLSHFSGPSR